MVNHDRVADPTTDSVPCGTNGLIANTTPTTLPANVICLQPNDSSAPVTAPVHLPSDIPNMDLRSSRVRFRSRVRITSGFGHHRRKSDAGSSRSGSSSSSISAPLRSHPHDNKNTWGTLGQSVGLFALQKKILGSPKSRRRQPIVSAENVNEHTPLRNSFNHMPYVEGEGVRESDTVDDSDDERLSQEVDEVFGKFPRRLLNPRWWYWQLEPLICCCQYASEFE